MPQGKRSIAERVAAQKRKAQPPAKSIAGRVLARKRQRNHK